MDSKASTRAVAGKHLHGGHGPSDRPTVRLSDVVIRARKLSSLLRVIKIRFPRMADAKVKLAFELNGEPVEVAFAPHKTLLEVLREDLGLTGTKHGCELGECGTGAVKIYEAVGLAAARLRGEDAKPAPESLYGWR